MFQVNIKYDIHHFYITLIPLNFTSDLLQKQEMKTKYLTLILLSLYSIFFASACLDRESEILSSEISYERNGDKFEDAQSGILYADGIFTIGDYHIFLEKFEVGRFEISNSTGNVVIDKDRWRSDYQVGSQGFIEITNIGTFQDFLVFDGIFEFNTYDRNDYALKREYRNGSFQNILVEKSTENLSDGSIQIEMEGFSLRQYVCDVINLYDYIQGAGSIGAQYNLRVDIPVGAQPGVYPITFGSPYPPDDWHFRYSNYKDQKYYWLPLFDDATGWPTITIEESDFDDGYVRGAVSGKFARHDDESDFVNIKNGSFEFNW